MEIRVTIDPQGVTECLAINAREDLLQDYSYFVEQAKALSPIDTNTMLAHRRFLRAALLVLFAYTEAIVNAWVHETLSKRSMAWLFKSVERNRLEDKMRLLVEAASASAGIPNLSDARRIRNLIVHFKPGKDGPLFDQLSLPIVEKAFAEMNEWMSQMEAALCVERHPNSENEVKEFTDGLTKQGVDVKQIQGADS